MIDTYRGIGFTLLNTSFAESELVSQRHIQIVKRAVHFLFSLISILGLQALCLLFVTPLLRLYLRRLLFIFQHFILLVKTNSTHLFGIKHKVGFTLHHLIFSLGGRFVLTHLNILLSIALLGVLSRRIVCLVP